MISSPFLYALLQISLFLEVATVGFHLLLIYALFSRAVAAKYRYAQMSYTVQIHIYILPSRVRLRIILLLQVGYFGLLKNILYS